MWFLVDHLIVKRLRKILGKIQEMSHENQLKQIPEEGDDEIGTLTKWINRLTTSIKKNRGRLSKSA